MVECIELHAGGLGLDPLGSLPVLCASLDVPAGSGAIISDDEFTLSNICEMKGRIQTPKVSLQGFP